MLVFIQFCVWFELIKGNRQNTTYIRKLLYILHASPSYSVKLKSMFARFSAQSYNFAFSHNTWGEHRDTPYTINVDGPPMRQCWRCESSFWMVFDIYLLLFVCFGFYCNSSKRIVESGRMSQKLYLNIHLGRPLNVYHFNDNGFVSNVKMIMTELCVNIVDDISCVS